MDEDQTFGTNPSETQKLIGILKQKYFLNALEDIKIEPLEKLIKMRNHFIHNDSRVNQDTFSKKGYVDLFEIINLILIKF